MVRRPYPEDVIPESEMWIQPDPNGDPSSLRFAHGNLVMFKYDMGDQSQPDTFLTGWFEGEVMKICMRLQLPPQFAGPNAGQHPPILYVVWPHSDETPDEHYGSHWIYEDTDDVIRPRMEDSGKWDPNNFNPTLVPPKLDPLSYLYTGVTFDPYDEEGKEKAKAFTQVEGVNSAKTNLDGTVTIKANGMEDVITVTVEYPKEPIFGVPGNAIINIAQNLIKRRQVTGSLNLDFIGLFKDSVPTESSLRQLEFASRKSKQLPRGAKNEEWNYIGIPVGDPEAMVACANTAFAFLKKNFLQLDLHTPAPTHRLVSVALQSQRGIGILHQGIYWLATAAKRGHVSPLTLEIARTVSNMELSQDSRISDDAEMTYSIEKLCAVNQYRDLEVEFQKLQETGAVPRGDPSDDTIDLFAEKSNQILCDMPHSTDVLHVEYRQIPHAPFPYVVYAIIPGRKEVIKVVRLPEYLQVCTFTEESFQYAWQRIAFELHLGNTMTGEGKRPSVITVFDSMRGSGTDIRLVTHMEPIQTAIGSRRRRQHETQLGEVLNDIEQHLLRIPNFLVSERLDGQSAGLDTAESAINRIANEIFIDNEVGQVIAKAQEFKSQGNELFESSDFVGATRCYSIAIELVRLISDPTDNDKLLLGTTLSNRAACYLEMESTRSSAAFQKLLVQNAIRDCTIALKSSWASRILPARILEKLKFRKDKATARLDVLQNEFQSEISSIIFPPSFRDAHQQEASEIEESLELSEKDSNDLLIERSQLIHDNCLAKNANDGCPVCLRKFNEELSFLFSSVLPCGEHAMCAECISTVKKQCDKERKEMTCPLCRFQFDCRIIQGLAHQIVEKDAELQALVEKFPADHDEAIRVAVKLLWRHDFRVDQVVGSIEDILDDRVSGIFFRTEADLSYDQKDKIYRQARRPVERLQAQLKTLEKEHRATFQTEKLSVLDGKIRTKRAALAKARMKARDENLRKAQFRGRHGSAECREQ